MSLRFTIVLRVLRNYNRLLLQALFCFIDNACFSHSARYKLRLYFRATIAASAFCFIDNACFSQALSMSKVKYFASFIEFVCGAQHLEFGAAIQPVALLALLVVIEGIDKLLGQRVALF